MQLTSKQSTKSILIKKSFMLDWAMPIYEKKKILTQESSVQMQNSLSQ